jgi:hypothetical protein
MMYRAVRHAKSKRASGLRSGKKDGSSLEEELINSPDQLVMSEIEERVADICGQIEIALVTVNPNTVLYYFDQVFRVCYTLH